jgi:hypothetical protein
VKQTICAIILCFSAVLAFPQTRVHSVVFVNFRDGDYDERVFFDKNLGAEVAAAGYVITKNILEADYVLTYSVKDDERRGGRILSLFLSDLAEDRDLISRDLRFAKKEDTYDTLRSAVRSMFTVSPYTKVGSEFPGAELERPVSPAFDPTWAQSLDGTKFLDGVNPVDGSKSPDEAPDAWKSRWFFLNTRAGVSFRYYKAVETDRPNTTIFTFDAGIEPEFHFLKFFALQMGADIALDWAEYPYANPTLPPVVYKSYVLSVPLMLQIVFNPSPRTTLAPYAGAYRTFALVGESKPPPYGVLWGLDLGVKTGLGALLFDLRYSLDLDTTAVFGKEITTYYRSFFTLSAGYKF